MFLKSWFLYTHSVFSSYFRVSSFSAISAQLFALNRLFSSKFFQRFKQNKLHNKLCPKNLSNSLFEVVFYLFFLKIGFSAGIEDLIGIEDLTNPANVAESTQNDFLKSKH